MGVSSTGYYDKVQIYSLSLLEDAQNWDVEGDKKGQVCKCMEVLILT